MVTLIRREFTVEAPREQAWRHLARVEEWPSWAKHIRRVELKPAGELGPGSTGILRLRNGMKAAFAMTEFNPPRSWKWAGAFLWLTVHYDHLFEEAGGRRTRLTWIVSAEGWGASALGRLFAKIYNRNLDIAIPLIVREMEMRAGG